MPIKIKASSSYYVTESSIDLPADPAEVDWLVRSMRANGKVVTVYNGGNIQGMTLEQRTRITSDSADDKIREILDIGSRKFNGDTKKS